jgi:hypothetical protein
MMGVLGFSQPERLTDFDEETFSWIKGERRTEHGASERTMVPFAVDIREEYRWVAFATAYRIRPSGFARGLASTLTTAVTKAGKIPVEWDVDLVADVTEVEEWLERHPDVFHFERVLRLSQPCADDRRRPRRDAKACC